MRRARIAMNMAAEVPDWIELIPAGEVVGRDGRWWWLTDPEAVALESLDGLRDVPIDYEHATENRAPKGEEAPAAGWITELEARNGALWGRVEWTPRGLESVGSREYRYISPAFLYDKARVIKKLESVGLTNSPNFRLRALNRREDGMDEELLKALGLAEGAGVEEAVKAVNALKAKADAEKATKALNQVRLALGLDENAGPEAMATAVNAMKAAGTDPDLSKYVPRAEYDKAAEGWRAAENRITAIETSRRDAEIEGVITDALQAGKITPATADYYRAQCRTEGGVQKFKEFVAAAPTIGDPLNLPGIPPAQDKPDQTALAMASMFGNSAEDLAKYGGR